MKVLLTGADGFLGSHVIRNLLERGYDVRAFLQKNRDHATIEGLSYEPFYGDLLNDADIANALAGCDIAIHTAAITDIWPDRNPIIWKINYDVVKKFAAAVKTHHIKRFIYVGTANSFGFGPKTAPGDETTPYGAAHYGLDYMDAKKAAQDFLLDEANQNDLPVIIINPTFMIGEYDTKPGSGEMVLSIMQKKVPSYANGGRCVVYVNDVAVAIVNAIEKGRCGQCYITGGTNLSYKEFFGIIAAQAGVNPPRLNLPYPFLLLMSNLLEFIGRLTKKKPLVSTAMVKIAQDGNYYSSQKAIRELDMPQTPPEVAVQKAVQWFQDSGMFTG